MLISIRPDQAIEASRGAGAQSVTEKLTGCGFEPRPEEMKYLFIFLLLRSGVEAKRGVDFRHSTHNASRTQRKVGNRVCDPQLSAYAAVCGIQRDAENKIQTYLFFRHTFKNTQNTYMFK